MAYAYPGDGALDYFPCRYGTSRLLFRGPRRDLGSRFVAVLGGPETYGKFVPHPFADLLETSIDLPVVNLGTLSSGLDVYLNDPALQEIAARAEVVVVQLMGAQNLTNRYYNVHPRRNDRFLSATAALKALYREVDFTEFTFTRHLLHSLQASSAERFERIAQDLRQTWLQRMQALLAALPGQRLLLWMAHHPLPRAGGAADLARDPLLITQPMVDALRPEVAGVVEAVLPRGAADLSGMAFAPFDAPAAAALPGPSAHRAVARALAQAIDPLI